MLITVWWSCDWNKSKYLDWVGDTEKKGFSKFMGNFLFIQHLKSNRVLMYSSCREINDYICLNVRKSWYTQQICEKQSYTWAQKDLLNEWERGMMSGKRKKRGLERRGLDLLQWCSDAPKHSLWKLLNSSEDGTAHLHPREKNWKTFHMKAWEDASSCVFNLWTESYCRRGDVPFELGYGKTKIFVWLCVCVCGRQKDVTRVLRQVTLLCIIFKGRLLI